jgi:hypothetical protein
MGEVAGVQSAFGILIFVVVGVAVVVAVVAKITGGDVYDQIGRGGLSLNDERDRARRGPAPGSTAGKAEREREVRQMLVARSDRRVRQGKQALDVDAEVARLLAAGGGTATDAGLVSEVRQLVMARNERRARQGKAPLDVEAEVARQLRELSA